MKASQALIGLYGLTTTVSAAALPDLSSVSIRAPIDFVSDTILHPLVKRKGGGGGGGGRGGGSSSSSGSSSSGSSSSGSGSSGSGSSGSSSGGTRGGSTGSTGSSGSSGSTGSRGSSGSNVGGQTTTGSGAPRTFGGGSYYGGGATTPYRAGGISPLGVAPVLLLAAPALLLGSFWAAGAYQYPYNHPINFRNGSTNQNQSLPAQCWCQPYSECGCDNNDNSTYVQNLVGDGTNLNSSIVQKVNVNGTDTLIVNGTLPNGTTATGGTDSPDATDSSSSTSTTAATGGSRAIRLEGWASVSGWWMMLVIVSGIAATA